MVTSHRRCLREVNPFQKHPLIRKKHLHSLEWLASLLIFNCYFLINMKPNGGEIMEERTIYFLFTDTGTYLARVINYCTKQSLIHVSIAFDHELKEVYSFGRKRPHNPFIGGFVKEDINSDFLRDAACAIYSYTLSDHECEKVLQNIKAIEARKHLYKYNFLGLFGVLLRIEFEREHALFCSQFVATVLHNVKSFQVEKPHCLVTPADIRNLSGLQLVYEGKLGDYPKCMENAKSQLVQEAQPLAKQSFIYFLSEKVKQFVVK